MAQNQAPGEAAAPAPEQIESYLVGQLEWRSATKKFDPERKIPASTWQVLEKALSLAPSSYGLQPYRALNVVDPQLRQKLRPAAYNQPQITDASHLVVFAARTSITTRDIDDCLALVAEQRSVGSEALVFPRRSMVSDLVNGSRAAWAQHWAARQAYIGLGVLLSAAALLRVDACPMEGFEPDKFDELLGLTKKGMTSVVLCALGYRASSDPMGALPKVRLPVKTLIPNV